MNIINKKDELYPEQLCYIKEPPENLFAIGDLELLKKPAISIIGSRCCSEYGKKMAKKFSEELTKSGLCIISGMAKGIDSIAHNTCINVGGKTIAIIASGFNYIYPKENIGLFNNIIKSGGLVISEYTPDTIPNSRNFPKRNRIISGLSLGTLVVEAAYRSGTSITAKFAKQQGKKVFCIPNSLEDIHGVGTNRLIKEGAKLVTNVRDILEEYPEIKEKCMNKVENKCINTDINIKKEYRCVYECLRNEVMHINNICKQVNMNINQVSYILTMLELDGFIEQLPRRKI